MPSKDSTTKAVESSTSNSAGKSVAPFIPDSSQVNPDNDSSQQLANPTSSAQDSAATAEAPTKASKPLMSPEQARIVLLEDELNTAASTIEFLHGCLMWPEAFRYSYPEHTEARLKKYSCSGS